MTVTAVRRTCADWRNLRKSGSDVRIAANGSPASPGEEGEGKSKELNTT
jgi:hypothetical protein